MKIDFAEGRGLHIHTPPLQANVSCETHRLTDVVLCAPSSLDTVPCCSVTRESIRNGFTVLLAEARRQHAALQEVLSRYGIRCHILAADPDLPDQCFTRDVAVTTPWGLVALNPAMPHRSREVDLLLKGLARRGVRPVDRIQAGTIEGGDVCIARPGLLMLGMSGERSTTEGASAFAKPFEKAGWRVLRYAFDPHFLHFDTMFCMLDGDHALACVDVLDDPFLETVEQLGITLIPVPYKQSRRLGCNVLSIDGRTILMNAGQDAMAQRVRHFGFEVIEVDTSQFTACGGGIHCLTMPLRREPS